MGVTESQGETGRDPVRARLGVRGSHKEPEREPVRARGNQSELNTTRKSHSEEEAVKESSQAAIIRENSLFSRNMLKYSIFLSKIVKIRVKS